EARRAVVPRPCDPGRGEGPGLVALVRVHVRRVEPRELARERDLARDPVAEERRAVRRAVLVEDVSLAGPVPEARVEVEARARLAHVPLRHERERDALLMRDLLRAVL